MSVAAPSAPDLAREIGLPEAARLLPPLKGGRPVHPSTLSRWATAGVRLRDGSVLKLRARRYPTAWTTTAAAVDEFIGALTADRLGSTSALPLGR